jgi:hypothetical protein
LILRGEKYVSASVLKEKHAWHILSKFPLASGTPLHVQHSPDQDVIENAIKESPEGMTPGLEYEGGGPSGRSTSQHPPIPQDFTSRGETSNENVTGEDFNTNDFQAVESEPRRRFDSILRRANKIRTVILEKLYL